MSSFAGGQLASRVCIFGRATACVRPQSLYEHGEVGPELPAEDD
jgi:hypothetical protein